MLSRLTPGSGATAERLFLIGDLKRKYGESIGEVLAYAADAGLRLADIEHRSERLAELASREEDLQIELGSAALQRSSSRRQAAAQEFLLPSSASWLRPAACGSTLRRSVAQTPGSRGASGGWQAVGRRAVGS